MEPATMSSLVSSNRSFSLGIRKRVDSGTDPSLTRSSKRTRKMSGIRSTSVGEPDNRMIRVLSRPDKRNSLIPSDLGLLNISSSSTGASRAATPLLITDLHRSPPTSIVSLVRSASLSSLRSSSPLAPRFPEVSAMHHLRSSKISLDYHRPQDTISAKLLSCSVENTLFFTRGNRVYYKSLNNSITEDVTQLYRLSDSSGHVRAIECGGKSLPGVVAVGTSKGFIQTWDISTRKLLGSWPTTKDISALAWNGPVLAVGGLKGTIRLYDTRTSPLEKMREQSKKITRHQGQITALSWNEGGKILASGDSSGMVHCWEAGQMVPLNVGEFVQRRKKIHHDGGISALAWSPWSAKLLATGDDKGVLRLWNVNAYDPSSNAATPGKLNSGAKITGIHFSQQCKEILTTHGEACELQLSVDSPRSSMANSISVHTVSLRHIKTLNTTSNKPIGDSVLNSSGMKIIFTIPDDGKINIYDVWAKRKELKREASFTRDALLYIR